VAVDFEVHPDNDATLNLQVEIQFSDYRDVNGFKVPFHLQRFLQRDLVLDISLTTAAVNSGLTDADFAVLGLAR
jgi:hypothetical protein